MNQSTLPILCVPGGRVLGMLPLPAPQEFTADTKTLTLGSTTYELYWHVIPARGEKPQSGLAAIPMTPTDVRQRRYPVGFVEMPEEQHTVMFSERNVIHTRAPIPSFWYAFATGRTIHASVSSPPDAAISLEARWSLEASFVSDSSCVYLDLDWTALGLEGDDPISMTVDPLSVPSFLQAFFVSSGIVPSLGATQSQTSPTLRLFRVASPVAGEYEIRATLLNRDGTERAVFLETTVD